MILEKLSTLSESQLQKLFTLISILIALQVMYIQHGWVNDDSVLYFELARLFSLGEWKQGIALYNWPLYPALISAVHQLTQFNFQTSAQLLNISFFAITTFSFIQLIRLAGGNKTTIVCGAILLLSSSYIVGDVLPMLLRDQGFWAMFLTSLVYFILFYRHQKLSHAFLWQISAILAMLFRIEAIIFLVALPFALFQPHEFSIKQKLPYFFQANLILILAVTLIASILVFSPSFHLSDFGRLQEVITIFPRLLTDITQKFIRKAEVMNEEILGNFLNEYGMMAIIISLASIIVIKIAKLVGLPVIAIFVVNYAGRRHTSTMQQDVRTILLWTLVLSLINACITVARDFILSGRYIIALGLILLIFAAFNLASLAEKIRVNSLKNRWEKTVLLIAITSMLLLGLSNLLPKQAGYNFEQDAVAYIKKQQIPNSKIFYVTPRLRFYAEAPYSTRGYDYWDYTQKAIEDGSIYQYEYLAIVLNTNNKLKSKEAILLKKLPQYKIEKEFYGYKKKKKVILFVRK
jgi:hypothetical protein